MANSQDVLAVSALLYELEREIKQDPKQVGTLSGVFQVNINLNGSSIGTWHMILQGQNKPPAFGAGPAPGKADVILTLEENDLIKLVSGGLSGRKALSQNRLTIKGDYALAEDMEQLFVKYGGPKKAERFIRANPGLFSRVNSKL